MSLTAALSSALSGLRVNQAGIALVSGNVANAETPGYTRKTVTSVAGVAGEMQNYVRTSDVNRELDLFVQRQLRLERAGGGYATTMADFAARLDEAFGAPGSENAFDAVYNRFEASFDRLVTSPDQPAARAEAVNAADELAAKLRDLTGEVQSLRTETEQRLSSAVGRVNELLAEIHNINTKVASVASGSNTTAALLDQRDRALDELSGLVDIAVERGTANTVRVATQSGVLLVASGPAEFTFDGPEQVGPRNLYSTNPAERTIGTIGILNVGGMPDAIATGVFRSGEIAALIEQRDQVLVETQTRLDAIAAGLSLAVSGREATGSAVVGPPAGQAIDLAMMQSGSPIRLEATNTGSGAALAYALVPQGQPYAARPGETVVRYTAGADLATIAAELTTALGPNLAFSATGTTLTATAGPAANRTVNRLSATVTASASTGQGPALPLFRDGGALYTGQPFGPGDPMIGLAGRISVSRDILADPSRLVIHNTSPPTSSADPTRPAHIVSRLNEARFIDPRTGIGTTANPVSLPVGGFVRETIVRVGQSRDVAERLNQGQQVVVTALEARFNESAGVDIDTEMGNLLVLQNAYAANARVVSAVREMFDQLINM